MLAGKGFVAPVGVGDQFLVGERTAAPAVVLPPVLKPNLDGQQPETWPARRGSRPSASIRAPEHLRTRDVPALLFR